MKNLTISLLLLFISMQMMAGKVIKNPQIEYKASWMTITEIELTKEATIVRADLHAYSSILQNTVLMDRATQKEYKFLRVEGVNTNERLDRVVPIAIYFEPLDAKTTEFNYVEVGNNPAGNFYGITLLSKNKVSKKTKIFDPESLNYDYYMSQPFEADTAWRFSNKPYNDLPTKSGKAQMKVHLCNFPKELSGALTSLNMRVASQVTRKEVSVLATIDDNNSFVFDIDLPHPQFVYVEPFGNFFITPGDTLEVFTTLEGSPDGRGPRFKTFRSTGESAIINTLLPKFLEKYGMKEYDYKAIDTLMQKGKDAVQPVAERWASQAGEILRNEQFRQALIHSPLSTFGKDLVMMSAVANKCVEVEDIVKRYKYTEQIQKQREDGSWEVKDNPDYVPLDWDAIFNKLTENRELIFNNPLALCESEQWVFVNRMLYSKMFFDWEYIRNDEGFIIGNRRADKYNMAGTFMNDLYHSQHITWEMEEMAKHFKLGQVSEQNREATLDNTAENVGEAMVNIRNANVAHIVVSEYRDFVKATEVSSADKGNNWTAEQTALWNKIISPYKDNLLIIDFWHMSCGPCRAGMKSQKPKVEELKDEHIKFLYVNVIGEKDEAEKWMGENNIKGEHIYVTADEWKMFEAMINFSAIPRMVLAAKDGHLVEDDFEIGSYSTEDMKALINRF